MIVWKRGQKRPRFHTAFYNSLKINASRNGAWLRPACQTCLFRPQHQCLPLASPRPLARQTRPSRHACPPAVGLRPNRFTGRGQPYPQHFVPRKRFKWYQAYQMRRLVPRKRFRRNKVEFPCLLSSPARSPRPVSHATPRRPRHETPPNKKRRSVDFN